MGIIRKFKREIRGIPSINTTMRKRKIVRRMIKRRSKPIPRTASYYARLSKRDGMIRARKSGKRRSRITGKVYYETRRDHSDKDPKKRK